jgi:hypothetical protein
MTSSSHRHLLLQESEALWQAYQALYHQQLTHFADDPLANFFRTRCWNTAFVSRGGKTAVLWLHQRFHRTILATEQGVVFAKRS